MTSDAIYKEHRSDWSHQVSVVVTTRWLQHDQILLLSAKGVACETNEKLGGDREAAISSVVSYLGYWTQED